MLQLEKFFKSPEGIKLFSIMLGLGVAGLFKMSCDSRSCLVYTGPNFEKENKVIKYNEKCYNVREKMLDCKDKKGELIYL
jgi:hypothetical protein|tara:strand:- start:383 stop:622 length:240 start_codon:yes stop_codon:yes gene_type:complete